MWEHPPHESAEYCSKLGTTALLPEPERYEPDWRGSDDEHGNYDDCLLDLRFHAAGPAAPVRRHTDFPDLTRIFRSGIDFDPSGDPVSAEKIAWRRRIADGLPGNRFTGADGAQRPFVHRHSDGFEYFDFYVRFVPGRGVHGHDHVLRADVPHGDAAGIYRVPEFAAFAGELRGVPHWSGRGMVRQIEVVGGAPGFRRDLQNLLSAHPFAGEVPAPRARNVRAVPLAAAFLRGQAHHEDLIIRATRRIRN